MAAIITDGPRAWLIDAVDRKLGRLFAAVAGLAMLAVVVTMEPGPARFALVCCVGLAWRRAAMSPRRQELTIDDLAVVEAAVLKLRADLEERTRVGFGRLDTITDVVIDIRNQVR